MSNGCPFHQNKLRAGLTALTERIAKLPLDRRGYPVPYFVAWLDGKPEFRAADPAKLARCHNERLCWVCGEPLGKFVTFPIGPMCSLNRITSEPPSHRDCSEWSVINCPFLSRPNMIRREDELTDQFKDNVAGVMIPRNPGVTALWTVETTPDLTRGYNVFRDENGKPLFEVGEPTEVSWWREGRAATREEVLESINSGLPILQAACDSESLVEHQRAAHQMLAERYELMLRLLPAPEEKPLIIVP